MVQLEDFDQIAPEFLKQFRKGKNLTLEGFWCVIGCDRTAGFRYEEGKSKIPETVKRILYLHYGVGIPTDCQSDEFLQFVEYLRTKDTLNQAVQVLKDISQQRSLDGSENIMEGQSDEVD